jgi:hypothetical protein
MGMRPGLRPLRGSICSTQNGGNLETRCAQTSKFLIPIFPCFEPAALIGAHTHSTRSAANIGVFAREGFQAKFLFFTLFKSLASLAKYRARSYEKHSIKPPSKSMICAA